MALSSNEATGAELKHPFHAICPYFAMFPADFVARWVKRLTSESDIVFDPFSGRGTTALTSLLLNRSVVACDVNNVAVCLTKAKTAPPSKRALLKRLHEIEHAWRETKNSDLGVELPEFYEHAYHPKTLRQILLLRSHLAWRSRKTDTMLAALMLGILHGDVSRAGSYLSNQMPRTISTKPRYSVKYWSDRNLVAPERDAFSLLRRCIERRYAQPLPTGHAEVFHGDMRTFEPKEAFAKCVITSPPYLNVTSFEEDQWLRLWFLGGPPSPSLKSSKDDRHVSQDRYWNFISDMWVTIGRSVLDSGHGVIRIGARDVDSKDMKAKLVAAASKAGRPCKIISFRTNAIRNRQTDSFRPGSVGCRNEFDLHFQFAD